MRLEQKITLTGAEICALGSKAMDDYVAGLETKDKTVIAAYLGTLMVMILDNIRCNMDLKMANATLESITQQWREHGANLPIWDEGKTNETH